MVLREISLAPPAAGPKARTVEDQLRRINLDRHVCVLWEEKRGGNASETMMLSNLALCKYRGPQGNNAKGSPQRLERSRGGEERWGCVAVKNGWSCARRRRAEVKVKWEKRMREGGFLRTEIRWYVSTVYREYW